MSFSAELRAYLGLDTKGFSAPLRQAARDAQAAGDDISKSFGRASSAHDSLLTSNHRVARQIQNFSRDLAGGASATDLLSAGLEGLERALKLPLGALAGLGVGAIAISEIHKALAAAEKLHGEIDAILSAPHGDARLQSLSSLTSELEELRKKKAELTAAGSFAADPLEFIKRRIGQNFVNPGSLLHPFDTSKTGASQAEAEAARQIEELGKKAAVINQDIARKIGQEASLAVLRQTDSNLAEAQKLVDDDAERRKALTGADSVKELGQNLDRILNTSLNALADKIAKANRERVQGTLEEIAGRPGKLDNSISIQAFSEGQQAREAKQLRAEGVGARERIGGEAGLQIASEKFSRADSIIDRIASLKESEKNLGGTLRGAIDSAQVLRELLAVTKRNNNLLSY
jgi:hypothetical protein